jgi:hypothetical protein
MDVHAWIQTIQKQDALSMRVFKSLSLTSLSNCTVVDQDSINVRRQLLLLRQNALEFLIVVVRYNVFVK